MVTKPAVAPWSQHTQWLARAVLRASFDDEHEEMKHHALYSSSKPAVKQGTVMSTEQIRIKVKAQGCCDDGQSGSLEARAQQSLQQWPSAQHGAQYGFLLFVFLSKMSAYSQVQDHWTQAISGQFGTYDHLGRFL